METAGAGRTKTLGGGPKRVEVTQQACSSCTRSEKAEQMSTRTMNEDQVPFWSFSKKQNGNSLASCRKIPKNQKFEVIFPA